MTDSTKVVVRRVLPDDEALGLIARFRCADPDADHQLEVERWVQDNLASWVFDPGAAEDEPQLFATIDVNTGDLVGVFAHEHAWLQAGSTRTAAEKITVVAVGLDYQGRRDIEDRRYSDIVMSAGLQAIEARTPPERRVFGLVHVNNEGSLRLLERHGMSRRISTGTVFDIVTHP